MLGSHLAVLACYVVGSTSLTLAHAMCHQMWSLPVTHPGPRGQGRQDTGTATFVALYFVAFPSIIYEYGVSDVADRSPRGQCQYTTVETCGARMNYHNMSQSTTLLALQF